ncbi:MAG: hypothetical protein AAFR41_10920 [Pseudomonadota bacterium]
MELLILLFSLLMSALTGLRAASVSSRVGEADDSRCGVAGSEVQGAAAEWAAPARADDWHRDHHKAGHWAAPACRRRAALARAVPVMMRAKPCRRIIRLREDTSTVGPIARHAVLTPGLRP